MVELSVEGKKQVVDIGDLVNKACELIVPKIGNAIKRIVAGADPEYQPILRNNIILSGGGSLIEGIAARMADEISDIGDVNVWCVDDPINAVATGALQLAGEMPDDMFTAINSLPDNVQGWKTSHLSRLLMAKVQVWLCGDSRLYDARLFRN